VSLILRAACIRACSCLILVQVPRPKCPGVNVAANKDLKGTVMYELYMDGERGLVMGHLLLAGRM
jgi:hypothetical protein